MLKCGFAQVDITPELGLFIPGYFSKRQADGVIDPLYARAFVADDGETVLAFVVMDIIHVSAKSTAMIRERASKATGIPEANIMVAATHIHTGSSTDRNSDVSPANMSNVIWTATRTADAVTEAYNNRVDAKMGYGDCLEFNVGFNRRYMMKDGTLKTNPGVLNPNVEKSASPIDPQVGVIRVDNAEGQPIGAVVNFSVHPDVVGGTKYCADYIGELARTMKKVYGESFGVVYMNGCCGDINHVDVLGGTNLPRGQQHLKMGKILAGDAIAALERTLTTDAVKLSTASTVFHGTRRRPTEADYEWAKKTLADPNASQVDKSYAGAWVDMFENPIPDPDIEVQASVIKFKELYKTGKSRGDVAICSLPGEIFVEIGLEIKKKSPFEHNIMCELANGYYGYISTRRGIELGGYETRINKSTNMDKETGPQLVTNHLKLLNQLR